LPAERVPEHGSPWGTGAVDFVSALSMIDVDLAAAVRLGARLHG
jgi:hypothetical protein